jgi:hypothetical protein
MKQTKGAKMFKKISTGFGATAIVLGILMMAGSAGDCDGKCMEYANTISEMLMIAGLGLVMMISGVFFVMVGQSE